jgi:hypothetical protein
MDAGDRNKEEKKRDTILQFDNDAPKLEILAATDQDKRDAYLQQRRHPKHERRIRGPLKSPHPPSTGSHKAVRQRDCNGRQNGLTSAALS